MMHQQPIEDTEVTQLSPNSYHILLLLMVSVTKNNRKTFRNIFKETWTSYWIFSKSNGRQFKILKF